MRTILFDSNKSSHHFRICLRLVSSLLLNKGHKGYIKDVTMCSLWPLCSLFVSLINVQQCSVVPIAIGIPNVQVSDTSSDDNSNTAKYIIKRYIATTKNEQCRSNPKLFQQTDSSRIK
jgi:hypothetical protein